jgi:5'-nucleotidase (lipoprotein e(P4) family)
MSLYAKLSATLILTCCLFVSVSAQTSAPAQKQNAVDNEYQTGAVLWTQTSAEYRALSYQAFALARLRLDQTLANSKSRRPKKPFAVVVDVDETVLDNSRFQAELILRGAAYTAESWLAWCERAEAGAVPGAVDFLNYASRRGVHVFYITNRRQAEKAGTMANLKALGFPNIDDESVVIRPQGATGSKKSRREDVQKRYQIALLVGDNLNDYSDDFSGKSVAERKAEVDKQQAKFGSTYIVIPNPMYGDWENILYPANTDRNQSRHAALRGVTTQPPN